MSSSELFKKKSRENKDYIAGKKMNSEREWKKEKDNEERKVRDIKWDNVKFVLITCVVIGHMLYPFFLLGLYMEPEKLKKTMKKSVRVIYMKNSQYEKTFYTLQNEMLLTMI